MKSLIKVPANRDDVTARARASVSNTCFVSLSTAAPITAMTASRVSQTLKTDLLAIFAAAGLYSSLLL
jgi:hypothetical protein